MISHNVTPYYYYYYYYYYYHHYFYYLKLNLWHSGTRSEKTFSLQIFFGYV